MRKILKNQGNARFVSLNKKLSLENQLLKTQMALKNAELQNSFTGLVSGITAQSNLTSFNPALQNNIYAPLTINWTLLMYMYKTHGIIQTMIDMPVLDALRGGLIIHSDQMNQDNIGELQDSLEEEGVLDTVGDAFIWARLFGGGALIINTESDYQEPLTEDQIEEGGQVEYYDACRWELGAPQRIPTNDFYDFYGKKIHKSRVLTIVGKRAPFIIRAQLSDWGMSEIERVLEDFNGYLRGKNVVYELMDEAKVDVYKFKGFKAQLLSANGTQITQNRVQQMNQLKNYNSALLMDLEDDYQQKQITFTGLAEMLAENRIGIASALRMPLSKIFGIASTGFSSGEDDIENYNAMVESEVRQPMKRILRKVLELRIRALFGDDMDFDFEFKPLRILSAKDEEDIKRSKSERLLSLYDRMLVTSKEVGEAAQQDNLVSIAIEAEQGLLEDHPAISVTAPGAGGEASGKPKPAKEGGADVEEVPAKDSEMKNVMTKRELRAINERVSRARKSKKR
jgi:phage-related protein (TIGR01555 family)